MIKFSIKILSSIILLMALTACVDDKYVTYPDNNRSEVDLSDVPDEIKEGYSVTFRMSLDPMGGEQGLTLSTRAETATEETLREIENFVDLEKLRLLFFTCLDDNDETGKSDIFLFESKSRWVSVLGDDVTYANWQVTCPVFTYGNNDDYDWDKIQEILINRPFKIAVLANRPDQIRYSDFDNPDTGVEFSFPNRGPKWGLTESYAALELYDLAKTHDFRNVKIAYSDNADYKCVNNLHHCQWDPTYAYKNSTEKKGNQFYDFILMNPDPVNMDDQTKNWMGACSYWTHWKKSTPEEDKKYPHFTSSNIEDKTKYYGEWKTDGSKFTKYNWYFWPSREQGIPMYGIQVFNPLTNWTKGTPFNISEVQVGDNDGTYVRKNIHLLRSLARIDLIIPKNLGTVHPEKTILQYSNVFARCEPMDVATPTEKIWVDEHGGDEYFNNTNLANSRCEWWNIYKYGPVVNSNMGTSVSYTKFIDRMAWFYGAWKDWWHFNKNKITVNDNQFTNAAQGMPSPRIFNTCIQRNQFAYLDDVCIGADDESASEYHFVIYTGERNINDPSSFPNMQTEKAELAFFTLSITPKNSTTERTYTILLTDYSKNTLMTSTNANLANGNNAGAFVLKNNGATVTAAYKDAMGAVTSQADWNWPIMRNHVYTFRVTSLAGNTDTDGINVLTIASEKRFTPDIEYY